MTDSGGAVLGLGCGEDGGSAEVLLKAALRSAERDGAAVELVRLSDLDVPADPLDPGEDLRWLWERLMACSGLIVSTPVISRTVAPRLKLLADVLLGPNADTEVTAQALAAAAEGRRFPIRLRFDERVLRPRVAGFLAVGGSLADRWKALALPVMHTLAFPMRIAVVDQARFAGGGTPRSILLDPAAVERAGRLGANVASQLGRRFEEAAYLGEPGLCPVCHLDVVVLRGTAVECATCGAAGELGPAGPVWTDLSTSLYAAEEKREHFQEMLANGGRQLAARDVVAAATPEYESYDRLVRPPRFSV